MKKLKERTMFLQDSMITFAGIGAGRVLISLLITLGVIGIPNPERKVGNVSVKVQTPSRNAVAISSLNHWTFVWELFYTDLDGANRRSGKVLLLVSKNINRGAGYGFEDMKTHSRDKIESNFSMDSTMNLPLINVYKYRQTALESDFPLGAYGFNNYFPDYIPPSERPEILYGVSHPDPAIPDGLESLLSPVQAREVSKLVKGMSYDEIAGRLKNDDNFRNQIKTAAGADIWKSMQNSSAFSQKQ